MNIYTLYALNEPETQTRLGGEFGHDIIGVYENFADAREAAGQYARSRFSLLIVRSVLGGVDLSSEEVWRWRWGQKLSS